MKGNSEELLKRNPNFEPRLPSWDKYQTVLFLLLAVFLFLVYGTILSILFTLLPDRVSDAVYYVRPPAGAWYFVGIILSIGTTGILILPIYRAYLGRKYRPGSYVTGDLLKRRVEGPGFMKAVAWLLTVVALFFIVHIYDHYVAVDHQTITINEFLRFGKKQYPLHDIQLLQVVQVTGKEGRPIDTDYCIQFKDGYRFDARDHMLDCEALIHFISSKYGIAIDTITRR